MWPSNVLKMGGLYVQYMLQRTGGACMMMNVQTQTPRSILRHYANGKGVEKFWQWQASGVGDG